MNYRKNIKNGEKLSQLGFGCMRLPQIGGIIDIKASTELIHSAIDQGVNYFDTAYIYPGSENALGQIIKGELRKKVNIATKLPLIITRSAADFDKYFDKQLERLQTDTIDYYLLHMITDLDYYKKVQALGVEDWLYKKKKEGRIRNVGFSFHGRQESFRTVVDAFDWEFCMIQYNYLDENYQAGTTGLQYAHGKGLPVFAMEPLRGGKLANGLPDAVTKDFQKIKPGQTPAEWGLRWVWNHPEVTLLLSGMGRKEQVNQNIQSASAMQANSLTQAELDAYARAVETMRKTTKVLCTGCGYCLPCPAGVDIPNVFSCLNETALESKIALQFKYMISAGVTSSKPGFGSQCIKCGKCESHCPQNIKIMDTLAEATKALEPFWSKPISKIARAVTVGK